MVENNIYFLDELRRTSVEELQSFWLQDRTIQRINDILRLKYSDFDELPWFSQLKIRKY